MTVTVPALAMALADLEATGAALAAAVRQQLVDQFECDDVCEGGINSLIGSPNPLIPGKNYTYTSAEAAVKMREPWREARRAVVNTEAYIEECRAKFVRAQLVARLSAATEARR